MSSRTIDQQTPLLEAQREQNTRKTPLPWRQFSIIFLLQLPEPLASQGIAPFAPQLIRDIGITHGDETQVGYYVGLLHSVFYATQALTVLHWSRLSDHIGRKLVILTGLFGISVSMYCFGLSKTFWGLVLSRSVNGALNGNIGIIKCMLMEITDSTNIAQAYAYIPLAWSTGASLGPYIGGSLSNPADRFPDVFGHWNFLKEYPYFLACFVPATFSAIVWLVTYLFLKETLHQPVPFMQLIKDQLSKKISRRSILPTPDPCETLENSRTGEGGRVNEGPLPPRALLVAPVLIAAGNYGVLALLEIAFRALQPVFFATPIELGGLGLDPPAIGNILFAYGALNGLFQILFFPSLHDRFGSKVLHSAAVASGIPLIVTFPLMNTLARIQGLSWMVWSIVGVHVVLSMVQNMGFACVFIYITASSPDRASLGATNGVAQLLVSIMRTFGPALSTSVFSISTRTPEHAFFVYYFMLLLVGIVISASFLLPRRPWNRSVD